MEFDDLSYFAHTNCFIRHDFLSLLKRKIYDFKNKKINMIKQYDQTKMVGSVCSDLLGSVYSGQVGAISSGQVGSISAEFPLALFPKHKLIVHLLKNIRNK
jgi:hypothetical protein